MSAYQYGGAKKQAAPLEEIEANDVRTRDQIARDIERTQRLIYTLQTKLETCRKDQAEASRRLADERAAVNDTKRLIKDAHDHARAELREASAQAAAVIEAAQKAARRIVMDAENKSAIIRETAFQQARAIQDDAHRAGTKRGREYAIARNRALAGVS